MDKLRRTATLTITFADGEQPTAHKVTAINHQLRAATNTIEKAVGDLWNQSGDSLLFTFPLQLPNLARTIGQNKYLNPCFYPVDEDFIYVDNIGTKFAGQNEIYLQFKPKSATIAITAGTTLTSLKSNKYDVDATGDYWVDVDTGRLISFDALVAADEVSYTVDTTEWNTRTETLPGVIPDPRQADYTSCKISQSGAKYYIHLPPRCPLSHASATDFDNGPFDGWSLPERYPPVGDLSDNYDATVATEGSKHLWQDPTTSALVDAFYRYSLPKELKAQLSAMTEGDTLPAGFLYLWDRGSGTIIADAVFKRGPDATKEWVFEVSSSAVSFASDVTTDETEVSYNQTDYVVIAVGSPLARSFWTLSNAFMNHTHGNEGDFSSLMEHSKLTNLNPPPSAYTGSNHNNQYPTDVPAWAPSRWAHDDHISLLSRAGSPGTSGGRNRDVNDNAMLGNLVMASTVAVDGNYLNDSANSRSILFGDPDSQRALLYLASPFDALIANNPTGIGLWGYSTNGYGLKGSSTDVAGVYGTSETTYGVEGYAPSGGIAGVFGWSDGGEIGIWGRSTTNYGIVAESDTTTPNHPALRIVPQDTEPTVGVEGDVYVNSTDHHLYCYLNGSWAQID